MADKRTATPNIDIKSIFEFRIKGSAAEDSGTIVAAVDGLEDEAGEVEDSDAEGSDVEDLDVENSDVGGYGTEPPHAQLR